MNKTNRGRGIGPVQTGKPEESGYARKQRLKAEGLWEPPRQPVQKTVASAVVKTVVTAAIEPTVPVKTQTPVSPFFLKENGEINEKTWWPGEVKFFRDNQFGFIVISGSEYYINGVPASIANLSSIDLYPGRKVFVRMRPSADGRPEVKSIKLSE